MDVTNRSHKGSDAVYCIGLEGYSGPPHGRSSVRILDERCCKAVKREKV